MFKILLLNSMFILCKGVVLAPGSNCVCKNPFSHSAQRDLGEKIWTCKNIGACFVDCDSDCGDVALSQGFLAKKDRCISKAACHAEAEESNFAVNVNLAQMAEKPLDDQFVLSGTGPVAEYQGHGLGLYTYDKDLLYYEQQGGDYYLVKDRAGWFTFPRISGCKKTGFSCIAQYVANLKTRQLFGPWYFGKDKVWTQDDSVQFTPLSTRSCLMCNSVVLNSKGPAKFTRPNYFGTFDRTSKFSAGRPVYRNKQGKHLMMKNEFTTFSVWDEVDTRLSAGKGDEGTRGVRSASGPTCVTDLEGGWQFQNKAGEWVDDESITAVCKNY